MTKELSIKSIKEELMDAFLGDMRIINSFGDKDVKKVTDYAGRNIFGYLNENAICRRADTYIHFDVAKSREGYDVFILLNMHKDLVKNEAVNRLDDISECIEEIVNELYPYNCNYTDIPEYTTDSVVKRQIKFMLNPYYKELYERESVEKND